jgi:predicted alpha/beta superfamily hydrolase
VDVWCPPGYAAGEARYPVIYMHDGQNLFLPGHSYAGVPWGVNQAVAKLMEIGRTGGALVVGIWNAHERRPNEYMPQKPMAREAVREAAARFYDKLHGPSVADAYLAFLVDELKPFIDATYRTRQDQAHTFVMGSSMGGLISLYALTEYPQVFGGAGCLSTHWPAGGDGLVDYFGAVLPRPGAHKLYFDFGTATLDQDYEPFQTRMDGHLRRAGFTAGRDWLTRKFPGAEHSETAWRERVHVPLEFLLAAPASASA